MHAEESTVAPALEGLHGARLSWVVLGVIALFGALLAGSMSALAARANAQAQVGAWSAEAPRQAQMSAARAH
ncbi:MAG: hypothetical protein AAF447_00130 [Myxococcota bacterium]